MNPEQIVRMVLAGATGRRDVEDMALNAPLLGHVAELDSMAIVTFLTTLEEEWGVSIDDDEVGAELFMDLEALVGFVTALLTKS